jgi:hypothetical protein
MPRHTAKTGGLPRHQTTAPNLLGRHSADQTGEQKGLCVIPPTTPGINQHSPLGRLTPPKKKLKTNTQQKGRSCRKHNGEGWRSKELISRQTFHKQRLERQKGRQWAGDKPLPEIGQKWSTKLISWATEQYPKSYNNAKLKNNQQTITTTNSRGLAEGSLPCPRDRRQGKETSPQ